MNNFQKIVTDGTIETQPKALITLHINKTLMINKKIDKFHNLDDEMYNEYRENVIHKEKEQFQRAELMPNYGDATMLYDQSNAAM